MAAVFSHVNACIILIVLLCVPKSVRVVRVFNEVLLRRVITILRPTDRLISRVTKRVDSQLWNNISQLFTSSHLFGIICLFGLRIL